MRKNTTTSCINGVKFFLLLHLFLAQHSLFAVKDENTSVFTAGWFKPASGTVYDTLRYSSYLPAVIDTNKNFQNPRPGLRSCFSTVTLLINPEFVSNDNFDVTLDGYYKSTSPLQATYRDSIGFTLKVNYSSFAGSTYKQRDAITINNTIYTLVVAAIRVNGLPITDENDKRFRVEINTIGDKVYTPVLSEIPTIYSIKEDATARNIKWSWSPITWAEYYELEYLHVDDYKADGSRKERTSLRYNFRIDAVRIRVTGDEYELPLIFEQGYVVARVRAVGFKGSSYNIPAYSDWSLSNEGNLSVSSNSVFEITAAKAHEADRLNWQYVSGFNESGVRSEAVSYADGTSRIRQQVASSPKENKLLVTETFYDHQGSAVIATLPAPIKPSATTFTPLPTYSISGPTGLAPGVIAAPQISNSQFQQVGSGINLGGANFSNTLTTGFSLPAGINAAALNNLQPYIGSFEINNYLDLFRYHSQQARIGFVPRFNVDTEGGNILRSSYDIDRACDSTSIALGTQSGAGKYYSPVNDERTRWQAYVPDAEGYPYAQLKFTNDGTGKIRESSQPGYTHRMGGGKTQKFFYGTPSQTELDRYFGNDAGRSSFYKKTLMLDENGQAHVSINNLKGNVVMSALAGASPENLEPLSGVTIVNDTIDLIAENSVLNSADHTWVSTKRLVLAATTDVKLDYLTTCPDFASRYCTGANFCYDCIYDLEIEITDGCGSKVYTHKKTIGTLDNINTCSSAPVTPITQSIRLSQGNYFIAKKLTVNEASIEAYVQNFTERFTCRADTLLFTPDIDAACNPECLTCNMGNLTAGFLRRDGGNVTLRFTERKPDNNSACQLACTQTGLSETAMAFQTLLSEVSPGGQYAEYRDTARLEDRPEGVVNPSAFALSVLNDANQLPLRNATWRNPPFNYQTKTGETAYVLIGEDDLPAHRSPAADIVMRDGRQFVLVKYLNDVSDFIRLWETQWAEALVVYHPEYEYYQWALQNKASFSFDSLLTVTEKYSDAVSLNLTDYRNDPLLPVSAASLRADMESRLANFGSIAGTPVSAAQMAILSVHCGNPNFSDALLRDCYTSKTLYGIPATQDKEWMVYKGLYRKTKLRLLANERNRAITSAGGFNNRTIGGSRDVAANSLYAGKRRLFKEEDDINDALELDFAGEEPTVAEVQELSQRTMRQRYADCGVCPVGSDLMMLLNALNYEKRLTATSVNLPGISPLVLTKNIVNSFSNNTALQYNWSRVNDPNPNVLRVKITTGGVDMGTLTLEKRNTAIKWDSLVMLDCLKPTGEYSFTLRIIDVNEKVDTVRGNSTCFRMNGCSFNRVCTATPARRDMLTFVQYLFETNRYKRSLLTVHTHTSHSPHFGTALRSVHPNAQNWQWAFGGFATTENKAFNARMNITEGRGSTSITPINCDFTFNVITPGFNLDSVGFVIAVRKPSALPTSSLVNSAELMVRSKGGRIFYIAMSNSCYSLFDCPASLTNATTRPAMCCGPAPHSGKPENDCETSIRLIARREVERDFEARRTIAADSVRAAYIRHCLNSVRENFTIAYNDAMYVATLYYYDLSGALVKTIPPKGVRPLTTTQIIASRNHRETNSGTAVYPNQVLATTYTYTSFGAVAEKKSPDEGIVKYAYDFAGRNILSRHAVHAANNHASYVMYDANNRMVETGRTNYSGVWKTFKAYNDFTAALSGKAEATLTTYDEPSSAFTTEFGDGQKCLRNRPSFIRYQNTYSTDAYTVAYSYDALGNVTRMAQHYPLLGFARREDAVKTTDYTFDKLSGKITRMAYQAGKADQFFHWLTYDANKRLTQIQTSTSANTPELLRDVDAKFYYYQHGPLARIEVGHERVQGIDYAYTIQGWLKGLNSYTIGNGDLDMGKDGTVDGDLHAAGFAKDVAAELLNYFQDDYKKIGTEGAQFYPESPTATLSNGFSKPLYNGNIQNSMMSVLRNFDGDTRKTFAQAYSYDQTNRIRQSKNLFSNGIDFESTFSEQFKMNVDYDLNGNITTLSRTGNSSTAFDNLTYHYNNPDNNNQLNYIADIGVSALTDLRNQSSNNFRYDAIGRLISDASDTISAIQNNNQSTVTTVNKSARNISYAYDAFGRRISKTANGTTEWYVNDGFGNPLAIYTVNGSEVRWKEASIYGGKRMGVYKPDVILAAREIRCDSLIRGNKSYELANHIGDVMAVVSDRKLNTADGAMAEVQAAHNYFPFGMPMPGRSAGNDEYRYGFQGMESEDNLCGENNSYTTEFRQYDPRIGRWLSVDPKAGMYANLSPYVAFLNNPVYVTDPKGDVPPVSAGETPRIDVMSTMTDAEVREGAEHALAEVGSRAPRRPRLVRPSTTTVGTVAIEMATGSEVAGAAGSALLPVDLPIPSLETEGEDESAAASQAGSAATIATGVRDLTTRAPGAAIDWASNLSEFSVSQAATMMLTMAAYTVANYWASIENSERLRNYAGRNTGFVYYLTLAVERAGTGGDLLRSSDLTEHTALSAHLFPYRDAQVQSGERAAFDLVHDMIARVRQEAGDEGVTRFLTSLRRSNSFNTAENISRITGAGERGADAAGTGGRAR
jgi:RHS repeat-associated protein